MAAITYITNNNDNGKAVMTALKQIREGLGTLQELDGLRAESIGAGQATMAANFGVQNDSQAQALSDRWGALLAAYANSGNAEYAKLRDLINATTWWV
jgi:hypothetical protein